LLNVFDSHLFDQKYAAATTRKPGQEDSGNVLAPKILLPAVPGEKRGERASAGISPSTEY
jgi:hypothetical protein